MKGKRKTRDGKYIFHVRVEAVDYETLRILAEYHEDWTIDEAFWHCFSRGLLDATESYNEDRRGEE